MAHDITGLAAKVQVLDQTIADLGTNGIAGVLGGIIHRPGWTTPREIEFVTASVESLQRQVTTAKEHYTQLISIADRIGRE